MDVIERFWSKVEKTENCWQWRGGLFQHGYGSFCPSHSKRVYAHRFSFQLERGKIPSDKVLDHLCRNRACVNPKHLEIVTDRQNILRGIGLAAQNHLKSHCPQGHELTKDNLALYQLRKGKRTCRICSNARLRAKRASIS